MKILFFVSQFRTDNLKLQPWLTIYRVGSILKAQGHQVHIGTDIKPSGSEGFFIYRLKSLRGTNSHQIEQLIGKIQPDKIIVCVSPSSLVTAGWYGLLSEYDSYAFMSNAFYKKRELIKAIPYLALTDIIRFGGQVAVPERLWARKLKKLFKGVICQSINTARRLEKILISSLPVHNVPPGIDLSAWPMEQKDRKLTSQSTFIYAGSPKKIRGFYLILKAFSKIRDVDVTLRILARGAGEEQVNIIRQQVKSHGIECPVDIVGGWISRQTFKEYLYDAKAVLLPFILVPSELPVTVMESIACGTPVIVSKIDGLPGASRNAGIVIPHADCNSLIKAVNLIHSSVAAQDSLKMACHSVRNDMLSWKLVADRWLQVMEK
jgi:glycosyltransferase involved in cell wall biosynthesis